MSAGAPGVRVIADDREAGAGAIAALRSRPEVELSVARLTLGDYEIDGTLLFERKTLPDLVLSIEDGRLFRQAIRLSGGGVRRSGWRPRGKERVQLRLLQGLPGVGPERARRLLR